MAWVLISARQFLKGWNANRVSEARKRKKVLLHQLEQMDNLGMEGLDVGVWKERYNLEATLELLFTKEELHWQQSGAEKWVAEGDANTGFFHKCANGRRKTRICSLESERGLITEQKDICDHIVEFYKQLFGSPVHKGVHMSLGFWLTNEQLYEDDKITFDLPFSELDVEKGN
jgi:hypothetical protein